jgi:aminoglycoside phosphotransferase (APT) family kinase protein
MLQQKGMLAERTAERTDAGFAPERIEAHLRGALPGLSGSMTIEPITGGQSNPTFLVSFANRKLVLRKKPAGAVLPSAHAVDREYRVQKALAGTGVPVPRMLLYCGDAEVIGTPFYVMEHLAGRVIHDNALPGLASSERRTVYRAMAGTLARLHAVHWQEAGLADFGRHGGYFSRQIGRWTTQWRLSKTRELPDIERLIAWLPEHVPEDDLTTIVHGDYRLGNLMLDPEAPEIVGVLDWELSTLGHPLADLAHNCIAWHSSPQVHWGLQGLDLAALGIPGEAEYLDDYYAECHHDQRMSAFHLAFALFRFAVIFEGIAARAIAGNAAGENAAEMGKLSAYFARLALEVVDGKAGS